jgi:glycosyltransferase involved in cell wall biosynthesis
MIEAMACVTPVIAMRRGSVPEIIEDGVPSRDMKYARAPLPALRRVRARWKSSGPAPR